MRAIINSFIMAFAMYSKIPMPKPEKNARSMKYTLCFFPAVGLVIGALLSVWSFFRDEYGFERICFAFVGTVIPVAVTGGVHLESFLRTADELHSGTRREKRREVRNGLQPGTFAVIAAGCYFMLYAAGLSLIWKREQLLLLGLSFVISRTLGGMSLVWFPMAEEETPYSFSGKSHRQTVRAVLAALLAMEFIGAVWVQPVIGAVMALAAMWVWTYYYYMSKKQFGGGEGDVSGYFICLCELACVLVSGMMGRVM